MTQKWLLPGWLVFLAVFCGLPAIKDASSYAFPSIPPQSQVIAGLPVSTNASPSQSDIAIRANGIRPNSSAGKLSDPSGSKLGPNLRFGCLTAADGMSLSMATSILQDQQGFMWFGTRYGLDKYDGNNFTVYLPGPPSDLMGGNFILNLFQDQNGDLWMGTSIDLVRWDMKTGKYVHYIPDPADPESLTSGRIDTIGRDSRGAIWIGTNTGLNRYNPATETFTRFMEGEAVLSIYVDHQGGAWLGTGSGLYYYGSGSLEQPDPVHYQVDRSNPDLPSSNVVYAIYEDRQGVVWVGTDGGGLNRLDRASAHFSPYAFVGNQTLSPDAPPGLSNNRVWSILEDSAGRLWIATQDGLNLLDQATGSIYQYHLIPGDPHSLSDDAVFGLYQDRSGVIWIATLGGICKLNEIASRFTHYQQGPSQPELEAGAQPGSTSILSDNEILSVYQDSHGILWIGTIHGGLNRLDRSLGSLKVYGYDPFGLGPGEVTAIYEDHAGMLWIGTLYGLGRLDSQTGTYSAEAAIQSEVLAIVEDQQGNLWAGTWEGLFRRKPGASVFVDVSLDSGLPSLRRILSLNLDRTGALWIATQADGLYRLDHAVEAVETSALVHFPQDSSNPSSPGGSPVQDIYEDPNGTLWLGTLKDGLVRFNRDTQTFVHFIPNPGTTREAVISSYVSCIQADAQGYLWMGTVMGLARFNPRRQTFSYYDARDGLVIGEGLSCFQNKQGEMFFGSWHGLNTFFPNQIFDNPNAPPVVITTLNLDNRVLRTGLSPGEQITLSYSENYLSFDFAALDYAAPAKNQYAYKMEGLDTDWVDSGARQHADYPDLKPGTYTFRVIASNNSGVWNEQGAAVRITITPPFWQTWWFFGLLGVALLGIVAGGVWLRLRGVEARSRELEGQVASRTSELVALVAQLTALQETSKAVASTLKLDNLLHLIVQQAANLLQADGGFINLVDKDRRTDQVVAVTGLAPSVVGERIPLEESFSGWVTLHNQATISNQIPDDERVARSVRSWVIEEHIQSAAVAPLSVRDQVMGTLIVIGRKEGKGRFDQTDLDLLVSFANQAAIAIENARLYEQSKEVAVLEERSRLARELHDAVTQTLFSASLVAEALPATWEKDPQEGRGLLQELRSLSRGALAEMRTLLLELRPAALLETSLADLLRQLGEAASGREGIPVTVQVEGMAELPPDVQIAFYRITQEALNNVVKHARAHQVTVRLCYTGSSVLLSISDDGRGFNPIQVPHNRLGLGIMQERAQAIGASFTVESQPGHGTQVTVLWEQEISQEAK